MGTPQFGVPSLERLAAAHDVVAVYTRPDAPSGRGRKVTQSAVKSVAEGLGLPVRQPSTLRDPAVIGDLGALEPDAVCVAAYGLILPPEVLRIPRFGCVNVHASILPRHRGAAPIERAILEGDDVTGVSIMRMEEGLDTGPVAAVRRVDVADRYASELAGILAAEGAGALLETLAALDAGSVTWVPQPEEGVTYAEKLSRDDVALGSDLTVAEGWRRVRASSPRSPSRARVAGATLTIVRATPSADPVALGSVSAKKGSLTIGFRDGALRLDRVRPEGRGEMDGDAWARGARVAPDATWGDT